jgi:6-phosphogluconate dehydrogenase (decarboxylating)
MLPPGDVTGKAIEDLAFQWDKTTRSSAAANSTYSDAIARAAQLWARGDDLGYCGTSG